MDQVMRQKDECDKRLSRDKVPKIIASFEHDAYIHVLALQSEVAI